jgi:hypothetical protein
MLRIQARLSGKAKKRCQILPFDGDMSCTGRRGGERQISRSIVEEAGENAGRPKVLPRLGQPEFRTIGVENQKRWYHRHENAGKQHGDLDDGREAEAVPFVSRFGCGEVGSRGQEQHEPFLNAVGPGLAAVEQSAAGGVDDRNDARQKQEIVRPINPQRFVLLYFFEL